MLKCQSPNRNENKWYLAIKRNQYMSVEAGPRPDEISRQAAENSIFADSIQNSIENGNGTLPVTVESHNVGEGPAMNGKEGASASEAVSNEEYKGLLKIVEQAEAGEIPESLRLPRDWNIPVKEHDKIQQKKLDGELQSIEDRLYNAQPPEGERWSAQVRLHNRQLKEQRQHQQDEARKAELAKIEAQQQAEKEAWKQHVGVGGRGRAVSGEEPENIPEFARLEHNPETDGSYAHWLSRSPQQRLEHRSHGKQERLKQETDAMLASGHDLLWQARMAKARGDNHAYAEAMGTLFLTYKQLGRANSWRKDEFDRGWQKVIASSRKYSVSEREKLIDSIIDGEDQHPDTDQDNHKGVEPGKEVVPYAMNSVEVETYAADSENSLEKGGRLRRAFGRARKSLGKLYAAAGVRFTNAMQKPKEFFSDEEKGKRRQIITGIVGMTAVGAVVAGFLTDADKGWIDIVPDFIDGDGVGLDLPWTGDNVETAEPTLPGGFVGDAAPEHAAAEAFIDEVARGDGITHTVRDLIEAETGLKATPIELKELYDAHAAELNKLPGVIEMPQVYGGHGFSAPGITTELPPELVEELINGFKAKRGL
jgi:hypothetical protein